MELLALAEVLRRRWWIILLPMVVVLFSFLPALPNLLENSTNYSVAIRFTAAAPSDVVSPDASYEDSVYVPWLASEYVVVNLPQWVTSDSFAREVSLVLAQNQLEIPYEDVRSAFVADSARSILVIYLTWDDETEIRAMSEAAIQVLQTRNQAYFPQFAAHPADIQPIDDIRVNTVATPLVDRFNILLRLGIGLAAGVGLAILAEYFDQSVRTREELTALGLEVLGTVPSE